MRLNVSALCVGLLLAGAATATTISTDVTYPQWNGSVRIFNPAITSVSGGTFSGNDAVVSPGATITMTGQWAIGPITTDYPCPHCVIQFYVAWVPPAKANGATPVNKGVWSGVACCAGDPPPSNGSGTFTFTTKAPTVPGTYYVGRGGSLDYYFLPGIEGGTGKDTATGNTDVASFRITVSVDFDGDGVQNDSDLCPNTATGSVVDATGCAIAQYCPCEGPVVTPPQTWKNHGEYVSCVARASEAFLGLGLITPVQKDAIVSDAAKSSCAVKQ